MVYLSDRWAILLLQQQLWWLSRVLEDRNDAYTIKINALGTGAAFARFPSPLHTIRVRVSCPAIIVRLDIGIRLGRRELA